MSAPSTTTMQILEALEIAEVGLVAAVIDHRRLVSIGGPDLNRLSARRAAAEWAGIVDTLWAMSNQRTS